jgi:hypothetical protein
MLMIAAGAASAEMSSCGWEEVGATVLATYPNDAAIISALDSEQTHAGASALKMERTVESPTPSVYVATVDGLNPGDVVTASFWCYDMTPEAAPSGRIWGHWNDTLSEDIMAYNGSAGGNSEYSAGDGWSLLEWSWTVPADHVGLVIEARLYSNPGDIIWIDDLEVDAPVGAVVALACAQNAVQEMSWSALKASHAK